MALVPCRECGEEVSEEAASCPHCGYDDPAGRKSVRWESAYWWSRRLMLGGACVWFVSVPMGTLDFADDVAGLGILLLVVGVGLWGVVKLNSPSPARR